MPTKPQNVTMNADAKNADYLNAIRTSASTYYQENVPIATYDAASVRDVGRIVLNSTTLTNEFYSALVNQFAFIFGSSKMFYNKWVDFKKGLIGLGELVEEFFVQIALPNNYNPDIAATEIFKRVIADVQTAIYRINVKTFYKTTINRPLLEMAFTTEGGMADLIGKVFTSMAAACEVDQMNAIKYLLARKILDGKIKTEPIAEVSGASTEANAKAAARQMKADFENFFFPRTDYNEAGVMNWVNDKNDVSFMLTTSFGAAYDIEVLAAAFNLDYANFMGRVKRIDSLTNIDFTRLNAFFDLPEPIAEFEEDEIAILDKVAAITFDNGLIQWYDRLYEWHEEPNGQSMEWQNWLHYWALIASSPFANAVAYVQSADDTLGTVTAVTSPYGGKSISLPVGSSLPLTWEVTGTGIYSKAVNFTSSGIADGSFTVSPDGVLTVKKAKTATTVNIVSAQDSSKKATVTITATAVS
jgi:hypothetical protein|nr:MAG TPA: Head protein [Caudoviricetes sp.]